MVRDTGQLDQQYSLLLPDLGGHAGAVDWLKGWVRAVGDGVQLDGYELWAVQERVVGRDVLMPAVVNQTGKATDSVRLHRYDMAPSVSRAHRDTHWADTKAALKATGCRLNLLAGGSYLPLSSIAYLTQEWSLVLLPDGDFLASKQVLYQSINLRKLNVAGRSGLQLVQPNQTHFIALNNLYKLPLPAPTPSNTLNASTRDLSLTSATTTTRSDLTKLSRSRSPSPPTRRGSTVATPPPDQPTGPTIVLDLVKLVQHALALFALGPVEVLVDESTHLLDEIAPFRSGDGLRPDPVARKLHRGDGLLCKYTLEGLHTFRTNIAEPLLGLHVDDGINLPPSLLAALLSTVGGARAKLDSLGVPHVGKDPFDRRPKFLRAVKLFQKQHKLTETAHLDLDTLRLLNQLHTRTDSISRLNLPAKAGRAIKSQINERASHAFGGKAEEAETTSIDELHHAVERGVGGGSIGRLWGIRGEKKQKDKHREGGQDREREAGEVTDGQQTSEGEALHGHSRGLGVFSSVREKAGRASRKIGDPFGLKTDSHPPSVVVSPESGSSRGPSPLPPPSKQSRHTVPDPSRSPASSASPQLESDSTHNRSQSFSPGLLSIPGSLIGRSRRGSPTPSIHEKSPLSSASSLGLGVTPHARMILDRTVSEAYVDHVRIQGLGIDGDDLATAASDCEHDLADSSPDARPHPHRRHSFNLVSDAPQPWHWLSRRRLELDVKLRMTAWELHRQEQQLVEMVQALEIVQQSYATALRSLRAPAEQRRARVAALESKARELQDAVDEILAPRSTLSLLGAHSKSMVHTQKLAEDKAQETLRIQRDQIDKFVRGADLDETSKAFGRGYKNGTARRIVRQAEKMSALAGMAREQLGWAVWGRWTGAAEGATAQEPVPAAAEAGGAEEGSPQPVRKTEE